MNINSVKAEIMSSVFYFICFWTSAVKRVCNLNMQLLLPLAMNSHIIHLAGAAVRWSLASKPSIIRLLTDQNTKL